MVKRIRPAKHYQRANNAVRQIILHGRRPIGRDLRSALGHLSMLVPIDPMVRLLKNGRLRELKDEVDFGHYGEVLKKPFQRIADVYRAGAQLGVRKINGSFHRAGRRVRFRKAVDVFNFDMFNAATQARLRAAQDALIQQLETDARDTIEQIVLQGAYAGLSAEDIVADIRDMIGLTDFQATAVMNYRRMLETLDPTALQRQLRNATMDGLVRDAIDSGDLLRGDVINTMVQDYTNNYLNYRASTIAQTESVRAANRGLHDAYTQAIDRGAIPDDAVRREWELGDMPCPICESIPDNNPDGVGVGEFFTSDDGPVSDPPVHPNCMCSVNYITDISKVPEEDTESGAYDTNVPIEGVG